MTVIRKTLEFGETASKVSSKKDAEIVSALREDTEGLRKLVPTRRKCLLCNQTFTSWGPANRLCGCQENLNYYDFESKGHI